MKVNDSFPSSYIVDIAPDWPSRGEEIRSVFYPLLHDHTGEFQDIRFYPEASASWIGKFEQGGREKFNFENLTLTTSDPSLAFVVSCGAGYWVHVETREITPLELNIPITQAISHKKHELILLATWQDIFAYRAQTEIWSLRSISIDDLKIKKVEDDFIYTQVSDGGTSELKIDLATGKLLNSK